MCGRHRVVSLRWRKFAKAASDQRYTRMMRVTRVDNKPDLRSPFRR